MQTLFNPKRTLVVSGMIIVIVCIAIYGLMQNNLLTKAPSSNEETKLGSNIISITPSQNVQTTTSTYIGWKSRQTSKYSIKYPQGWFSNADITIPNANPNETDITNEKIASVSQLSKHGIFCVISQQPTLYPEDADAIALKAPIGQFQVGGLHGQNTTWTKTANMTIGGYAAASYIVDQSGDTLVGQNYQMNYIINKGGTNYTISCNMNKSVASSYTTQISQLVNSMAFF